MYLYKTVLVNIEYYYKWHTLEQAVSILPPPGPPDEFKDKH